MKIFFSLFLIFSITYFCAQVKLDTSKLVLFGTGKLSEKLIYQADSLLIAAVNHYNEKAEKGCYFIALDDNLYKEYLHLDSLKRKIRPYLKNNNRLNKIKFRNLPLKGKIEIDSIYKKIDFINQRLEFLDTLQSKKERDPIVSSWGYISPIFIENYCRQYIYRFDYEGNCKILAVCFCEEYMIKDSKIIDWKKTVVNMFDGANCYFTIQLDLQTLRAYRMIVNGI